MKSKHLLLITLIPALITITACGSWWLPRPHKIDIQQGNLLTPEVVAEIKVGMSKGQVIGILGRPLTTNQINPDRWEYIYSINRAGEKPKVKRLSLQFQGETVTELETDGLG